MKVAIVHEWFTTYAGSEKVVEQLLKLFPQADIFVTVDFLPEEDRAFLHGHKVTTSFIQKLPFAKKKYRGYLPLMPLAVEQFDLSAYDLIISSSHAVAKGVITGPNQLHISYVHSPMRYAWDLQHQYLRESGLLTGLKGWLAKYLLHRLRLWDLRTANGVDVFVSNSAFIAKRIWKIYRRESVVIYPPVAVDDFALYNDKQDYYLTASRMVPYKKMDLIVSAFCQMPDKQLMVIGDGPDRSKIEALAAGCSNIIFLGYQPSEALKDYMQRAKAFVFAAEEDFGITPVEAQACGTPVIAFGKGGALETIIDGKTGLFFAEQSMESLQEAVERFDQSQETFLPQVCRANAERFSESVFHERFKQLVAETLMSAEFS
jgi:glycosyltransferase involved in cell wall biosynthesis